MSGFVVLHMESNGLAPARGGRVFEAALVRVENGRITQTCHHLMNPGLPLPPFLTTLTGITPSMVREAPLSAEAMAELQSFLGDSVLVAHNASLDRQVWQHEMELAGLGRIPDFLCTLRLARRLYPWSDSQKIPALAQLQGINRLGLHKRALDMAQLKAQVFLRMQKDLALLYPDEAIDALFLDRYQKTGRALTRAVPEPS
ncbi:MAG: 3'-5' exonuclease [Pedobacter sp.]|nr:3'-5' exonuclease [Pedobacter sp.]